MPNNYKYLPSNFKIEDVTSYIEDLCQLNVLNSPSWRKLNYLCGQNHAPHKLNTLEVCKIKPYLSYIPVIQDPLHTSVQYSQIWSAETRKTFSIQLCGWLETNLHRNDYFLYVQVCDVHGIKNLQ